MYSAKALTAAAWLWACAGLHGAEFSGEAAFQQTAKLVAFGPRPSGSPTHAKVQQYIRQQLAASRCKVEEDAFIASTPLGQRKMSNIIAVVPGKSGKSVAVSGHYDTKLLPGNFVGANDGGSSAGFLLELARVSCGKPRHDELMIVFLDGEEAVREWTDSDSLYGSRHLAAKWSENGTAKRMKALINVDMIGDRNLVMLREMLSTEWLLKLVWDTANELGHGGHFYSSGVPVGDDHQSFLRVGIPAVDLIDFNFGPNNSYWHTDQDTMDKLSPRSFQVVGDVVVAVLRKLETYKP